jgi:predicted nicotinamide N-methyase
LVLVGDPGRAYLPTDRMIKVASYDVPVVEDLESVAVKHTTVWQVR